MACRCRRVGYGVVLGLWPSLSSRLRW